MRKLKLNGVIFAASFIVSTATFIFVWWLVSPKQVDGEIFFLKKGYDFQLMRDDSEAAGPKIGEVLDLSKVYNVNGEVFSNKDKKAFSILVVVSPECPACKFSEPDLHIIAKKAKSLNFNYYPILFSNKFSAQENKNYSDQLNFSDSLLVWKDDKAPMASLLQILTPSHILINSEGKILYVWLGTNKNDTVRIRMREQIISDLTLMANITNSIPVSKQ